MFFRSAEREVKLKIIELMTKAAAGGPAVLWDGAVGTQLLARGLSGQAPELWNLERPEVLVAIHADYLKAGAQVVQTNTFGANRIKLAAAGLADRIAEINQQAVAAARQAVERVGRGLVAGDVGPTGQMLEPNGPLSSAEAEAVFAEQIQFLASAGCDLISIETMFDLNEAQAAVRAAKKVCGFPVVAEMTFQKTPRGFFTMMGVTPEEAVSGLLAAGAFAVGANCNLTIAEMVKLIREMKKISDAPLIAQPNAGEPRLVDGKTVYAETAQSFASLAPELRAAGASALGACCGSSPEFIAALRERLPGG